MLAQNTRLPQPMAQTVFRWVIETLITKGLPHVYSAYVSKPESGLWIGD